MAQAISSKKSNGAGCLIAFFAVFFLMGSATFVFGFVLPALNCSRAQNWIATPCKIVSSTVATRGSGKERYYYPDIFYRYSVNGQSYDSARYNFFKRTSKNSGTVQGWLNAYPVGSTVTCFVSPADPSQAVLDRSIPSSSYGMLAVLIFAAVGIAGMIWQVKALRTGRSNESRGRTSWTQQSTAPGLKKVLAVEETTPTVGPVVLKPAMPAGGVACGLFFFALIWNGFLGFFIFMGPLRSSTASGINIFMGLFLIPFVLVGLGVLVAALASVGSMFVARPKLTASTATVALGESFDLEWQMQRGMLNPQKLQVRLEAREEATYTRGTDTYTDRNVFFSQEIFEGAAGNQNGQSRVTIPTDSMHSFDAARNKVVWVIKVKGDVPLWPNFEDEFRIRVLPTRVVDPQNPTPITPL